MGAYDEVPAILDPYGGQLKVWEQSGKTYKQHDLVPSVGMAETYAIWLDAPPRTPPRFLTVQENRITNLMAHQPIVGKSVFDKWGRYLGRGGENLDPPGPNPVQEALSVLDVAAPKAPAGPEQHVAETFLEPPSEFDETDEFLAEGEDFFDDGLDDSLTRLFLGEEEDDDTRLHKLWLRDDFRVRLRLPLDLTEEEAERLALFVRALPCRSHR